MFGVIWGVTSTSEPEYAIYTAFAFLIGAIVSTICGAIGMVIATGANFRTTFCAKHSLSSAFRVAYRAGCSMGFALVSLGLLGKYFLKYSSYDLNFNLQSNFKIR